MDAYLGDRPAAPAPLKARPIVQRVVASGAAGWTPPGGIARRWDSVVIHHSASDNSTPQGMREYHMNERGWDELGYHFVIGNGVKYGDGQVFVGARWSKQMHGAHCKTADNHYNQHGVGICLIGNLDNHPPTPKQVEALARLTSFLMDECRISRGRVLTHGGITHKTACPGRHFSLTQLTSRLSRGPIAASSE